MNTWNPNYDHPAVEQRWTQGGNIRYGVIRGTERVVFPGDGLIEEPSGEWTIVPRSRIEEANRADS